MGKLPLTHFASRQVDIFAAGIIIYFMLRGKLPFSAETHDAMLETLGMLGAQKEVVSTLGRNTYQAVSPPYPVDSEGDPFFVFVFFSFAATDSNGLRKWHGA